MDEKVMWNLHVHKWILLRGNIDFSERELTSVVSMTMRWPCPTKVYILEPHKFNICIHTHTHNTHIWPVTIRLCEFLLIKVFGSMPMPHKIYIYINFSSSSSNFLWLLVTCTKQPWIDSKLKKKIQKSESTAESMWNNLHAYLRERELTFQNSHKVWTSSFQKPNPWISSSLQCKGGWVGGSVHKTLPKLFALPYFTT